MNRYLCTSKLRRRRITPVPIYQLFLLLLIGTAEISLAAKLSREQRVSVALEAALSEGSPVWLEAESVRFLAIHRETSAVKRLGSAVLLHDSGSHADWHEVINPLRRHLAERGWDTLSIQTPITDDPSDPATIQSLIELSLPRIQAAIDFLTEQQTDETVLIGHGLGAGMAMKFVTQPGNRIGAIAAIGVAMSADDEQDPAFLAIKGAETAILDLYGSRDHPSVVDSAPLRRAIAIRNGRKKYRQVEVSGADHFFSGMQEELGYRIAAWLRQAVRQ
ncbi:MAG: alpha/beta hydrolase family protein [Candidatus Thiodiazotropha sp. (ex Lucina pensylvanica)]|nr:alpha/beta hydrolase family protein [Candidatus Thiodiazotropha sp. (ex Lucina pensylvanica)]